jgi:ribosomal protein S18 acetylase RimI-like enzyme
MKFQSLLSGFTAFSCRPSNHLSASTTTYTAYTPFTTQLSLIPLITVPEACSILEPTFANGVYKDDNGTVYEIGIAQESDLPDLAEFLVSAFGSDAIQVSRDFSAWEQRLMQPAVTVVNQYSTLVTFTQVLAGLRQRMHKRLLCDDATKRLAAPNLKGLTRTQQLELAEGTSLILIVSKHKELDSNGRSSTDDWRVDIVASIEMQLQPADGKIPFSLPWIDIIERKLARWIVVGQHGQVRVLQPYVSNLCVDPALRGKGVGRALFRCVEKIARDHWKFARLYLHVDLDNEAALNLYSSEGYEDAKRRWRPFWAGKAADIGYLVKKLN